MTAAALHRLARPLLILQVLGFVFFIAGTHGAFAPLPGPPTTTDFSSFYTAGLLANQGRAADAYREAPLYAAEQKVIAPGIQFNKFLNPPPFLLLCAPLAHLPYLAAFVLFEALSCLAWLLITTRIAGGGGLASMCLMTIPSVWWALGWGQNSFVTASLFGAATLLLAERPFLAGAAFGALIFKPHFAILVPLALLAGRQWRAITGAALSAALLLAASALLFGVQTWQAFLDMTLHARAAIESGGIKFQGHADLAGALRLLGAGAGAGWAAQAALSVGAAGITVWVWARGRSPQGAPARYAVLIAATLAAMPFLLFYDLVLAGTAAAWLVRAGGQAALPPGTAAWLITLAMIDAISFPAASILGLPAAMLVAPGLLFLAMKHWRLTDMSKN